MFLFVNCPISSQRSGVSFCQKLRKKWERFASRKDSKGAVRAMQHPMTQVAGDVLGGSIGYVKGNERGLAEGWRGE